MTTRRRPPRSKSATQTPTDSKAREYRDRAKAEENRYADSVDVRTWVAFCFPTLKALEAAQHQFGLAGNHEMIWHEDLDWDKYQRPDPKPWRGRALPLKGRLPESPFAGLPEPTGDLEADSREEVYALLAALEAAESHPTEPRASNIWTAVVFPREKAKHEWLTRFGLDRFGDIYLDGTAALDRLIHL
jgi:hypothetical protein